jgi:hypothetical protein
MRENCTYGSEGGDGERRSRPLSQRCINDRAITNSPTATYAAKSLCSCSPMITRLIYAKP